MARFLVGPSTMDLRLHSHEFIIKFIDAFRKNPCLWNTLNPEYRNKKSRLKAYNRLLKFARKVEPKITVNDVKKKLQSIRASHRKEKRKVTESLKTSPHDVYVPKLWYYKELDFLTYHNMEGPTEKSNLDNASEASIVDNVSENSINVDDLQIKQYNSEEEENDEDSLKSVISNFSLDSADSALQTWEPPLGCTSKKNAMQRKTKQSIQQSVPNTAPTNEILNYIASKIERNRDECDIFGKNVAAELRTMNHEQRIIAKKLMNDVIFHGQLQQLTVDTQIQINNFYRES